MAYESLIGTDEPLYQRVGRAPLSDADLEAAIAAWRADNPDADELQVWGAERRLRQLNEAAQKRASELGEARRAGVRVEALRVVKAAEFQREREAAWRRELDVAHRFVTGSAGEPPPAAVPPTQRRRRGRPGWTKTLFDERYSEAVALTGPPHTDDRIAANFRGLRRDEALSVDPEHLAALRRRRAQPNGMSD